MKYVRITSCRNGHLLAEQLYLGTDQEKAIERFLQDYPEHIVCDVKAEPYDNDESPDHFAACLRCGCVN